MYKKRKRAGHSRRELPRRAAMFGAEEKKNFEKTKFDGLELEDRAMTLLLIFYFSYLYVIFLFSDDGIFYL